MRVAQLTLDGYFNYGNILQKYALQQVIKKFTSDTEVIWHSGKTFSLKNKFRLQLLKINALDNFIQSQKGDSFIANGFREAVRRKKIEKFETENISVRFNPSNLEKIAVEYDYFIVGSDQVWQPKWTAPKYFLNFVPRKKRIAYAASIAAPKIPDSMREFFRKGISGFDYISVREEKSVEIIKELTGQNAILVLDPTMLLTPQEWLEIAQKPSWFDEKYQRGYILTYYLRNNPPPLVAGVAKHLNLQLINLLDLDNYWHYITGPEEFVYLFSKASLVFTNSFHGCIFSILFKRPFVNIEIDDGGNMTTRIPGLLKMFGLESRIMLPGKSYTTDFMLNIDYRGRDIVLPIEREKAFNFLSSALGVNTPILRGGGQNYINIFAVTLQKILCLLLLMLIQEYFFRKFYPNRRKNYLQ